MKTVKQLLANVAISQETHKLLISHIQSIDGKIGKFVDRAIKEKIDRDAKKKTTNSAN